MIKKYYVLAWFLLAASVLVSVLTGTFNPLSMVVSGLVAVGLVYGLALWTAAMSPQEMRSGE